MAPLAPIQLRAWTYYVHTHVRSTRRRACTIGLRRLVANPTADTRIDREMRFTCQTVIPAGSFRDRLRVQTEQGAFTTDGRRLAVHFDCLAPSECSSHT